MLNGSLWTSFLCFSIPSYSLRCTLVLPFLYVGPPSSSCSSANDIQWPKYEKHDQPSPPLPQAQPTQVPTNPAIPTRNRKTLVWVHLTTPRISLLTLYLASTATVATSSHQRTLGRPDSPLAWCFVIRARLPDPQCDRRKKILAC